jgi:hypothetical protein
MTFLPGSEELSINSLSRLFDKTSASYKLLLFKSLLDEVQNSTQNEATEFKNLALKSLSYAYYTISFYKLSFGKSDRMTRWTESLSFININTNQDYSASNIYDQLLDNQNTIEVQNFISEFSELVPYRLLSPFFENELRGLKDHKKNRLIQEKSLEKNSVSLYKIEGTGRDIKLTLNSSWYLYMNENYSILRGWLNSSLVSYLQLRNPTVLSVCTKLEPPLNRNMNLIKKEFEDFFHCHNDLQRCLYSGKKLDIVSHDHYFPWSFFGSDPVYNFVPSLKSVNSSKSNNIPSHDRYFNKFTDFQWLFFKDLLGRNRKKTIEYYLNDLHITENCNQDEFKGAFNDFYTPLHLTSKNQSFSQNWIFRSNE